MRHTGCRFALSESAQSLTVVPTWQRKAHVAQLRPRRTNQKYTLLTICDMKLEDHLRARTTLSPVYGWISRGEHLQSYAEMTNLVAAGGISDTAAVGCRGACVLLPNRRIRPGQHWVRLWSNRRLQFGYYDNLMAE